MCSKLSGGINLVPKRVFLYTYVVLKSCVVVSSMGHMCDKNQMKDVHLCADIFS